jgi:hypothetical protein
MFIIDDTVHPNPRNLQTISVIEDKGSYAFGFDVRSEDANEEVVAALFYDYKEKQTKDEIRHFLFSHYEPARSMKRRTIALYMTVPDLGSTSGLPQRNADGAPRERLERHHEAAHGHTADLQASLGFQLDNGTPPLLSSCPDRSWRLG